MHNTRLQCAFQQKLHYFYSICSSKVSIYSHTQIGPSLELCVLHAKKAQWNMAWKQLAWWCYMEVHIVWWVGHPSGRLQLPKAVSSSAVPGPTAAHTHLTCSSYTQACTGTHTLAETNVHTYRHEQDIG